LWEFPGGKVRPDESPAQAAARECMEETGLAVEIGQLLRTIEHRYEHAAVRLSFFAARPLDPAAEPHSRFRWVAREELAQYEFPPANDALIAWLAAAASTRCRPDDRTA
jgi:mutator protein MutT